MPASDARRRASIFDPIRAMTSAGGPAKIRPAGAGLGKRRVLGEESIPRMDGVRGCGASGVDELRDRQIALGRRRRSNRDGPIGGEDMRGSHVGVGVDRDALDAELLARTDDANGDLASVRHEEPLYHCVSSCTKDTKVTKDTKGNTAGGAQLLTALCPWRLRTMRARVSQ